MLIKNTMVFLRNEEVVKNVDVHIENDTIDFIGTNYTLEDIHVFDGTNMIMMPGLCNTHCHVPMTLLRGLGGNSDLNSWLNNYIFPTESKLTSDYVYYGGLLGISEMIKSGVTSFNDMYYYSNRICDGMKESGIKGNIALDGFAFNPAFNSKFAVEKEVLYDFKEKYHGDNIKIDMCIHAQYTTTEEKVSQLVEIAKNTNSNIQLHLSETEKENIDCFRDYKKSPTEFFNDLGVFSQPTTVAHCVYLNDKDINILKENNATVSHCPVSNLKLGSGIADIIKLKNVGLNITIGTDGAASNNNLEMLSDIKTAILLQKGIHKDPTLLSAKDILTMASYNGMKSQGRKNSGVLDIGKKADFFMVDFSQGNLQPVTDILEGVVYSSISENIVMTVCNGKVLYKNGEFLTIDIEKVINEVSYINQKLY